MRSVTFADFSPNPIGVSSGPLRTMPVRWTDSIVSVGTPDAIPLRNTSAPASACSQAMSAPAASTIARELATTSLPMPSPAMTVTFAVMSSLSMS